MTIQQCIYAIEIAKTGSFSRAAKQLFIAQSSLSSSIKSLEFELDITIFERSKNGVFLTAEGAEFIRYAEQIVEQNKFIMNRYSTPADRKKLYVSTQHYDFVADVFCELLRETSEENFDFSIREIQTYDVIRDVETAYSDIGIIAIKDSDFDIMNRYLGKKGLNFTQFLKVPPHVFIRQGHPLSKKNSLTYESLRNFPYVSYEQGSHNTSFFTEELADGMNTALKHVKISDRATLMNVLLTTDCYTVGTGIIPSALNDGKIICVPIPSDSFYRIGYIMHSDRNTSELTQKLINLLCNFARKYNS